MTPPLELLDDGATVVISNTQLNAIKTCAAYWKHNYIYRRVRAGTFAARDAGKAFDDALNERYKTLGSAPVTAEVETRMEALIDKGFADLELGEDEYRTPARYKQVLRDYNALYTHEPWRVLAVQMPIAVELGSVPFRSKPLRVVMHGILDLLIERDDGAWVCDTKTMNKYGSATLTAYENASQSKGYCWMVQQAAREQPDLGLPERVLGFALNAVCVKQPVKTKRRDGSPDNEFHRHFFHYSQERLEEWRVDSLAWVHGALGWVERDYFPQNDKQCAFMYGRTCPYLDVCTAPAAQREMILGMDLFKDYDRGPLGQVEAEEKLVETP